MNDEYRETIVKNRRAGRDYYVHDEYEAGLQLRGSEVKSIREGRIELTDAYASFQEDELYLVNAHVAPYSHGSHENHRPERPRKLLLHRSEIERLRGEVQQSGYTLIPLEVYVSGSLIKVRLGVCEGKKKHDKREDLKKQEHQREIEREQARRQRDEYSYDG